MASGAFTSEGTRSEEESVEKVVETRVYNSARSDETIALTRASVRSRISAGVKRWGDGKCDGPAVGCRAALGVSGLMPPLTDYVVHGQ